MGTRIDRKVIEMDNLEENITKATQTVDLLLQDLQSALSSSDALSALLVAPELKKVADLKIRLESLISAFRAKR